MKRTVVNKPQQFRVQGECAVTDELDTTAKALAAEIAKEVVAKSEDMQAVHEMTMNVNQPKPDALLTAINIRLGILNTLKAAGHDECAHKVCLALQRDYPEYFA